MLSSDLKPISVADAVKWLDVTIKYFEGLVHQITSEEAFWNNVNNVNAAMRVSSLLQKQSVELDVANMTISQLNIDLDGYQSRAREQKNSVNTTSITDMIKAIAETERERMNYRLAIQVQARVIAELTVEREVDRTAHMGKITELEQAANAHDSELEKLLWSIIDRDGRGDVPSDIVGAVAWLVQLSETRPGDIAKARAEGFMAGCAAAADEAGLVMSGFESSPKGSLEHFVQSAINRTITRIRSLTPPSEADFSEVGDPS